MKSDLCQQYRAIVSGDFNTVFNRMSSNNASDAIGAEGLLGITVTDCGEGLVRILDCIPNAVIDMRGVRVRFPDETLYVRESIGDYLAEIAAEVAPYRLRFFDAHRPIEIQELKFAKMCGNIQAQNLDWDKERVEAEAATHMFRPSYDPQTPPPHSTGAEIDLTITDSEGNGLDMGTDYGAFDNPALATNYKGVTISQRENRVLLLRTMVSRGFVNYPGEWYHFSFGDREWVAYMNRRDLPTIFGRAEDPYKE